MKGSDCVGKTFASNKCGDFVVIDTARNGQDAVDKVKRLKPDLVTMPLGAKCVVKTSENKPEIYFEK